MLLQAYNALTRVGNATADTVRYGPESGGWDPLIDDAHHRLGLLLAMDLEPEPPAPPATPHSRVT